MKLMWAENINNFNSLSTQLLKMMISSVMYQLG